MHEISHGKREPLIRIAKRDGIALWKGWLIRLAAVVLALCVCAVVINLLTGLNPLEVYETIIQGAVGSSRRIWMTIRDTMMLLCISVAITPAFKMKFWNIGAEGQVLIGGLASAAMMIYFGGKMPGWLLLFTMFAVSVVASGIFGLIPAFFKAKWNTNETLFTLMLNYVAIQIVNLCVIHWENPSGSNSVGIINPQTKYGWLPQLFGLDYGWCVAIVVLITVFMFFYLKYSKHGYEISVVGESENTARYAGINVKKVVLRTMAISAAICGIAGFLLVSGSSHTISTSTSGGRGFTAIVVSWLAKFNAFTMAFISFLLIFLEKGAIEIASKFDLSESASEVITGIILFFVLGCEFFINYRVIFRKSHKEGK